MGYSCKWSGVFILRTYQRRSLAVVSGVIVDGQTNQSNGVCQMFLQQHALLNKSLELVHLRVERGVTKRVRDSPSRATEVNATHALVVLHLFKRSG